jgi:hypothetical protein
LFFFLQIKYLYTLIMPGCSIKEAFPGFVKDVNENPQLNENIQRYGVEIFHPNTVSTSPPLIESFSPYTTGSGHHESNIGTFERIIPENIEKLLEQSTFAYDLDENNYLFDRIPQVAREVAPDDFDRQQTHLSQDIISHIKKCSTCRNKLNLGSGSTTVIRENIRPMDQMIELSTFLATGIFIILILDILTKTQR